MSWRVTGWGYEGQIQPLKPAQIQAEGNRVEYQREEVTEWYINERGGIEQGFTIQQRPIVEESKADKWIEVQMELSGDLTAELSEDGQTVWLKDEQGNKVLKYGGLYAYDSQSKKLPSQMLVNGRQLTLQVNDREAVYPITIDPKINMGDGGGEKDYFGWSVDIDGERFVVGVPGFRDGIALVFVKDANAKYGWKLEQKLVSPTADLVPGHEDFGHAVSINGNTIVVGELGGSIFPGNFEGGSVYIFVRNTNSLPLWTLQQKLQGDNPGDKDNFGFDVDIDKDLLIVGAIPGPYDPNHQPSAYLFSRKNGVWSQVVKVLAPDKQSTFGTSVAIADQIFVVGAPYVFDYASADFYPVGEGGVYVYSPYNIGNPGWTLEQKLMPNEPVVYYDSYFVEGYYGLSKNYGWDVDIKQTQPGGLQPGGGISKTIYTVAVGQPDNRKFINPPGFILTNYQPGAVFIFERSSTWGQPWAYSWTQTQKLQASDKDTEWWHRYEQFGYSVGVSPNRIVVGSPTAQILNPMFNSHAESGAVYVFWKKDSLWKQVAKHHDPDYDASAWFGSDVAVFKTTGVFGIPYNDVYHTGAINSTPQQGSVWVDDLIYLIPNLPDPIEFP